MNTKTKNEEIRSKIKKEITKSLKKIELHTEKLVNTLLSGAYKSIFLGNGIDFSELRHYVIGDDVKFIDWKATARTNQVYVKQFQEERESTYYFIFDYSKGMFFSNKLEFSLILLASLMNYAVKTNNTFYLTTLTHKMKYYGRFKTQNDVYFLIGKIVDDILENYDKILKHKRFQLKDALNNSLITRYTHTAIISDFIYEDFTRELINFSHYTVDLVGFQVVSNDEIKPKKGVFVFDDIKVILNENELKYRIDELQEHLKRLFYSLNYKFFVLNSDLPINDCLKYVNLHFNKVI